MKLVALFVVLSWNAFNRTYGQIVNIENKHIVNDTTGWAGNVDGSFAVVQNKLLLFGTSFRSRIQYKAKNDFILWINDFAYTGSKHVVYNNAGMSHLRYAHRIYKGLKWESFTQVQYNQILSQRLRAIIGTGLRLKTIENKNLKSFVGISSFYEYEVVSNPTIFHNDLRGSSYLSWFVNAENRFSLSGTLYYQPLWINFKDYRLMLQTNFAFPLFKKLDLKFETNIQYDAKPPVDVLNLIFSSSFGLSYKF